MSPKIILEGSMITSKDFDENTKNIIKNFDDFNHRIESATATFQKGLYHLFIVVKRRSTDVFAQVLRKYQSIFQLCLTQLLLDMSFSLNGRRIQRRLREKFCKNPKSPTRKELDPAAIVTHHTFEEEWKGFPDSHPLSMVSKNSLTLYQRVVEARHNLLYRPFLLAGSIWEDCTLIGLLGSIPKANEIEQAYRIFIETMLHWHTCKENGKFLIGSSQAQYFLRELFLPYKDLHGNRPTETLVSTYTRELNKGNEQIVEEIKEYRNRLVNVRNLSNTPGINFLEEWKVGEL